MTERILSQRWKSRKKYLQYVPPKKLTVYNAFFKKVSNCRSMLQRTKN